MTGTRTSGADGQPARPAWPDRDAPARVSAVERLVAQGPAGERLERLTRLAAAVLGTPFAQVSLLGREEQVVAAVHGSDLPAPQRRSPLADSLCTVTAATGGRLVVSDAREHPWVRDLPPVTSGALSSYLGVGVTDSSGLVLGSLCVHDRVPREWDAADVGHLEALAEVVAAELEVHARSGEAGSAVVRLQLAAEAADLGSYDYDLRTGELVWDDRMLALHGYTAETFRPHIESFDAVVHPDDRVAVAEAMAHAIEVVGELIVDYRVRLPGGPQRWIKARGRVLPDMLGEPARILGAAYDSSAERELRDELTRLMETMPAGFLRVDRGWQVVYVNAVAETIYGSSSRELVGQDLWEAFPAARGTVFEEEYRRALATGEQGLVEAYFEPLDTHFEVRAWPDEHGLSLFFNDVSDRRRADLALQQVSERLAVLSQAGERLSASLQPREVLAVLAGLIVPALADWLVLVVVDEVAALLGVRGAGTDPTLLHPVHLKHADPDRGEQLESVVARQVLRTTEGSGVGRAVRTGEAQALSPVPEEVMAARASDPAHLTAMRALNTEPVLSVALRSPSGVLGAFTVGGAAGREPDAQLLGDLATRASVALDNALTYARQRRGATELQSALLPREAVGVPEVLVATRYIPASADALAGGDFFKTVRVGERLVMMLGDVMGHGLASAARAGQLHGLVAALALEGHGPGALLSRLAEGVDQMMDLELATLLICSYDPATRTLTAATAGHPPPLVAPCAGGSPYFLELQPGPPIGVSAAAYVESELELAAAATVVLYSDGLVERRGESISTGLERLRQALADLRLPPEAVADHVLDVCGGDGAGVGDDDIALLVVSHP